MRHRELTFLLFALGLLRAALPLAAATVPAESCSYEHVLAAFSATHDGDTVKIPAGTCEWTQQLSWTAPPNITIMGAGDQRVIGGGDVTVIVDKFPSGAPLLQILTSGGIFRLTGITIRGATASIGNFQKSHGAIQITGPAQTRLDHLHMDADSNQTWTIEAHFAGVIDHSLFHMAGQAVRATGNDHQAWAEPTAFGGKDFIYFESNDVISYNKGNATFDCYYGGKYVLRRNNLSSAGTQTHPTGGSSPRGCRATEVYQNTVTGMSAADPAFNFFWLSSGVSLIWGNDLGPGWQHMITLHSMRRNNDTYPNYPPPDGWGFCGTSFTGAGSNWDGNTDPVTGYPCMDQPGQGQGDLLAGGLPSVTNVTRGCGPDQSCANPRQKLEPIYEWLNIFTSAPGYGGDKILPREGDVLVENRDWYLEKPSFNGTSGAGVGPIANRPTTCTPGVFYWATDAGEWDSTHPGPDGEGYQCSATNTWSLYYRPYTFPHPLITGGAPQPPGTGTPLPIGADLSAVKVYPNPWRSDKHTTASVKFTNFVGEATLKIFTTSGYEVKRLSGNGSVTWLLDNNSGDRVASGIYVYSMTTPDGQKKRGKVAVIR